MTDFIGAFCTPGVRLRAVRLLLIVVGISCAVSGAARAQSSNYALPSGWSSQDIGKPKLAGGALSIGATIAVAGTGADIGGTSDQFTFAYQRVTGDVDIVARVATFNAANGWSKAGVMIRASLDPRAANGLMLASAARGLWFQTRRKTGAGTSADPGDPLRAPAWVKLERRGGAISAFSSRDGKVWKFVGTEMLTLPETLYVGVAVTSRDVNARAIAAFDKLAVNRVSPQPDPSQPSEDEDSDRSDEDGTSDPAPSNPPDDGGNPPPATDGSDSAQTPPPSSGGDSTTPSTGGGGTTTPPSSGGGGTTPPSTSAPPGSLVFTPSSDHATNVTGYRLEISLAAAPSLVLLRLDLGKPAVVGGQCQTPLVSLLTKLLPGKYVGVLKAYNSQGTSPGISGSFTF